MAATPYTQTHSSLRQSLGSLIEPLRVTAELLEPFLPSAARGIQRRPVPYPSRGEPLFAALPGPE